MKKDHIDIPMPSSRFYRLECSECNEQQVVYSHATMQVFCNQCGSPLASSSGSKANLTGRIRGVVDSSSTIITSSSSSSSLADNATQTAKAIT